MSAMDPEYCGPCVIALAATSPAGGLHGDVLRGLQGDVRGGSAHGFGVVEDAEPLRQQRLWWRLVAETLGCPRVCFWRWKSVSGALWALESTA